MSFSFKGLTEIVLYTTFPLYHRRQQMNGRKKIWVCNLHGISLCRNI